MIAGPGVFHGTGVDPVSDPAAFVAEADGFSSAATRMGVATAGVSKAVLRPEDRLGLRLSTRTTRRVRPTTDGERFPPQARAILAEVDAEPREGALRLEGRVRVDAPVVRGAGVLAHAWARCTVRIWAPRWSCTSPTRCAIPSSPEPTSPSGSARAFRTA